MGLGNQYLLQRFTQMSMNLVRIQLKCMMMGCEIAFHCCVILFDLSAVTVKNHSTSRYVTENKAYNY